MTFSDDELKIREVIGRIDLFMRDGVDDLAEAALDDGLECWHVADGFLFAAFRVIEEIEEDRLKIGYARHLERLAGQLCRMTVERLAREKP
jgi:hypothetical protein